jgi:hypothetical protein
MDLSLAVDAMLQAAPPRSREDPKIGVAI